MRIAICDDEQLFLSRLSALIIDYCTSRRLEYELSAFADPALFQASALACYDVVFLDANMGEVSGIEAARALRAANKTAILVYVSAFVEYAPMGYEVDAFRYLMKHSLESSFVESMDEIVGRLEMKSKRLTISTTQGEAQVVVDRVLFMESFRHNILFHLSDGSILESKQHTLTELAALLKPHHFLRIHKSFLVNPEHIATMKSKVATLDNGQALNCGKLGYPQTLRAFMLWKGGA